MQKMITIYAKLTCGCCTTEMQFKDITSARKVFKELGHLDITDDAGNLHEGVDTFYGFEVDEDRQLDKGLDYLVNRLGDLVGTVR